MLVEKYLAHLYSLALQILWIKLFFSKEFSLAIMYKGLLTLGIQPIPSNPINFGFFQDAKCVYLCVCVCVFEKIQNRM